MNFNLLSKIVMMKKTKKKIMIMQMKPSNLHKMGKNFTDGREV